MHFIISKHTLLLECERPLTGLQCCGPPLTHVAYLNKLSMLLSTDSQGIYVCVHTDFPNLTTHAFLSFIFELLNLPTRTHVTDNKAVT